MRSTQTLLSEMLRVIDGQGHSPLRPRPRGYRYQLIDGQRFSSFDFVELRDGRNGRIGPIFFHPGGIPHPPAGTGRWPRVHSMVVWTEEATKAESHIAYEKIWGKPRRGGNRKFGKGVVVTPHDIARVFPKILPVRVPRVDRP